MDTVGDILDLAHPDGATALHTPTREYDYHRFRATTFKVGNYLRHCGVGDHAIVAVLDVPAPETVFGFLGTALLGGAVAFDPVTTVDATVLLGPTTDLAAYDVEPGCKRVGFDEEPSDPSWAYFEREVWSENPFFPESPADQDDALLPGLTQREVVDRAEETAAALTADDEVAVRGPFADPGTVVDGVLAPLVAGASIVFPDDDLVGTVAVGGDGPEGRRMDDHD
ncbi:MAG: hypothetical protein ABEJ67_05100 [Halanaeroarchaeum sp.]